MVPLGEATRFEHLIGTRVNRRNGCLAGLSLLMAVCVIWIISCGLRFSSRVCFFYRLPEYSNPLLKPAIDDSIEECIRTAGSQLVILLPMEAGFTIAAMLLIAADSKRSKVDLSEWFSCVFLLQPIGIWIYLARHWLLKESSGASLPYRNAANGKSTRT